MNEEASEIKPKNGMQRTRVTSNTVGLSMTKQSFRDESNINIILAKYAKTSLIEHVNKYEGRYEDVTGVEDYHTSLNRINAAGEAFMSLPSGIRSKFQNDPGNFLDFVNDPTNREEMYEMGLAKRLPEAPEEPVTDARYSGTGKVSNKPVQGDLADQSPLEKE